MVYNIASGAYLAGAAIFPLPEDVTPERENAAPAILPCLFIYEPSAGEVLRLSLAVFTAREISCWVLKIKVYLSRKKTRINMGAMGGAPRHVPPLEEFLGAPPPQKNL